MLDDTPRKLLRIIYHFSGHFRRMPTLPELERLSGRLPGPIKAGMQQLADQNYITWNHALPVETAIIIEGWERNDEEPEGGPRKPQQPSAPGNTDYWQYY
ncbi:hypothetical protein NSS79_25640 [Paenibacillus sp. FSL L8-0436]|uniref:hypothetical protein n=1 Tax=Paenibacillus sp. FSL L8-0436 TaxID=2954686 RepID=UPI0031584D20